MRAHGFRVALAYVDTIRLHFWSSGGGKGGVHVLNINSSFDMGHFEQNVLNASLLAFPAHRPAAPGDARNAAATAVPAALGVAAAAAVVVTCATTSTAARAIGRGAVSRISAAAVARRATRPLSARARAAPPVSRRPRRLQRHRRPHQRKAAKVRRRSD